MELTYSPARPEDGPVIFGFAKELIERYETDPALDLEMALGWTKRKIEKRIDEYTRAPPCCAGAWPRGNPCTSTCSRGTSGPWPSTNGRAFGRWRT